MRIMRNAVRKVTALLRVNCAVPELTVTLNHYHGLVRRSNIYHNAGRPKQVCTIQV